MPAPGVEFVKIELGTATALGYPSVPPAPGDHRAGVIGLELGSVWSRLGARVTELEYMDRILPGMDAEVASTAKAVFKKQGLNFELGVRVTGAKVSRNRCIVEHDGGKPISCDRVLVAVGECLLRKSLDSSLSVSPWMPRAGFQLGPTFRPQPAYLRHWRCHRGANADSQGRGRGRRMRRAHRHRAWAHQLRNSSKIVLPILRSRALGVPKKNSRRLVSIQARQIPVCSKWARAMGSTEVS